MPWNAEWNALGTFELVMPVLYPLYLEFALHAFWLNLEHRKTTPSRLSLLGLVLRCRINLLVYHPLPLQFLKIFISFLLRMCTMCSKEFSALYLKTLFGKMVFVNPSSEELKLAWYRPDSSIVADG